MIKRFVSLALALALCFSLVACAKPNVDSDSDVSIATQDSFDIITDTNTEPDTFDTIEIIEKNRNIRFRDTPYMWDETIFNGVTYCETNNAIYCFDETVDPDSAFDFVKDKDELISSIISLSYLPKLDGKIVIAVSSDLVTELLNETTMVCTLGEDDFNFTLAYLCVLFGEYFNYGIIYGIACEICHIELEGDLADLENTELLDLNYFCLTNDEFYDTEPVKRYAQLFVRLLLSEGIYDPIRNRDEETLYTLYVGWLAILGVDYEYEDVGAKFSCRNLQGEGKKIETANLVLEISNDFSDTNHGRYIMREYSTLKDNIVYLETVVTGLSNKLGYGNQSKTTVYWVARGSDDLYVGWSGIDHAGGVASESGLFPMIRASSIYHFQHEYTHILDDKSNRRWKTEMLANYLEDIDFGVEVNYVDLYADYTLPELLKLYCEAVTITDELELLDNVYDRLNLIYDYLCYSENKYISIGDEYYANEQLCSSFMNYLLTVYPEDDIIASLMATDEETLLDKPWHQIKEDYVKYIKQKFAYLE